MTNIIDKDEVLESLNRAIAAKGADYVYPQPVGCVYVHANRPSCIVGHVIADLFPDRLGEVARWEKREDDTNFSALQEDFQFPFSEQAQQLLSNVQAYQDRLTPWGQSLDNALNCL